MAICVAINVKATCGMGTVYTPFHEETYDQEGDYLTDIDFDGFNEKICVDEYSNVKLAWTMLSASNWLPLLPTRRVRITSIALNLWRSQSAKVTSIPST